MKELSLNILDIAKNSVKAEATLVEISIVEEDGVRTLTIRDDGYGMSPAFLAARRRSPVITPGSTVAVILRESISRIRFIAAVESTTPPVTGTAPPATPVPPPLGVTGTWNSLQSLSTVLTSPVDRASTYMSGARSRSGVSSRAYRPSRSTSETTRPSGSAASKRPASSIIPESPLITPIYPPFFSWYCKPHSQ